MSIIKNILATLFIVFYSLTHVYSQLIQDNFSKAQHYLDKNKEVYFQFVCSDKQTLQAIEKIISVDKITGNTVFAYANKKQFSNFLQYNINYIVLSPPSELFKESGLKNAQVPGSWNSYPTYSQYLNLMDSLVSAHPDICKLYQTATTVNGRKILFVKISENVDVKGDKPEFMYSSTMHGDEVVGYVLMLRLIDYLLSNYGKLKLVTNLVNSVEIWINPLANPDGTYNGGDNTVSGAIRLNGNAVDLNRNFPDPQYGAHPDYEAWQPETIGAMALLNTHHFVLAANFHGGSEVVNYPWDTWQKRHPDDAWYQFISHQFADSSMFYGPSGYFTSVTNNGITDGYDWYTISGGRQDYHNYFAHGREVTIELSDNKLPSGSTLPGYWDYNYRSFIYYIQQSLFGIRGIVSDSTSGKKLSAKIEALGHDADSSQIYSDSLNGDYHRLINQGSFNLKFSAPGYRSRVIKGVLVKGKKITILNVKLLAEINSIQTDTSLYTSNSDSILIKAYQPDTTTILTDTLTKKITGIIDLGNRDLHFTCFPNPFNSFVDISFDLTGQENVEISMFDLMGRKVKELTKSKMESGHQALRYNLSDLSAGIYICRATFGQFMKTVKLIRE